MNWKISRLTLIALLASPTLHAQSGSPALLPHQTPTIPGVGSVRIPSFGATTVDPAHCLEDAVMSPWCRKALEEMRQKIIEVLGPIPGISESSRSQGATNTPSRCASVEDVERIVSGACRSSSTAGSSLRRTRFGAFWDSSGSTSSVAAAGADEANQDAYKKREQRLTDLEAKSVTKEEKKEIGKLKGINKELHDACQGAGSSSFDQQFCDAGPR